MKMANFEIEFIITPKDQEPLPTIRSTVEADSKKEAIEQQTKSLLATGLACQ